MSVRINPYNFDNTPRTAKQDATKRTTLVSRLPLDTSEEEFFEASPELPPVHPLLEPTQPEASIAPHMTRELASNVPLTIRCREADTTSYYGPLSSVVEFAPNSTDEEILLSILEMECCQSQERPLTVWEYLKAAFTGLQEEEYNKWYPWSCYTHREGEADNEEE